MCIYFYIWNSRLCKGFCFNFQFYLTPLGCNPPFIRQPSICTYLNLQDNMWKCCKSRDYLIFLIYQLSVCADAFGSWGNLCSCKQSPRCLNGATPQQSSSVFSMPVWSPASTRPPNTSALTLLAVVSEALCLFGRAFYLYFGAFFVFWRLCSVPGPFSLAVPQGSALHRFVWRLAAGCHIVPRVLIWCQLLSIFTSPPCRTLSACVTACLHPLSA